MFPKTKRFVDKSNDIPAVGTYDVKDRTSAISHSFLKSDRFFDQADSDCPCDVSISSMDSVKSTTSNGLFKTPKPVLIKGKHAPATKRPQSYSASNIPKQEKKNVFFAELEKLKELCARKDKEIGSLQRQLESAYKDAKGNLESVKKEFSSTIAKIEDQKATLQKELCELSQDAVDHSLTLDGLHLQIKFYTEEVGSTKQELRTMHEMLKESEEKYVTLVEESQHINKEVESSKQSVANLEKLLANEKSNNANIESDLNARIVSLQELNHKSLLEMNLLKEQIHSLKESLAAENFEHQKVLSALEQERVQLICISRSLKEAEEATELWRVKQQGAVEALALAQLQQTAMVDRCSKLEKELIWSREELKASKMQVSVTQQEIKSAVSEADEQASAVKQELSRRLVDTQKRLSAQEANFIRQKEDSFHTIASMQKEIDRLKDENIKTAVESDRWKMQLEDLVSKYQPFCDQLESLDSLKSESSFAQAEFLRVSADYAKLLGHQNPKQKIHYVSKLKDENVSLKQENTRLKMIIAKQKKQVDHSNENSLAAANGKI